MQADRRAGRGRHWEPRGRCTATRRTGAAAVSAGSTRSGRALGRRRDVGDDRDRKHDHEDPERSRGKRDGIVHGHAPRTLDDRPEVPPSLRKRLDATVPGGALAHLAVEPDGVGGSREQGLELRQALPLGRELEKRLLHLVAEVDPRADLKGEVPRGRIDLVDLHLRRLDDATVRGERAVGLLADRVVLVVEEFVDLGGRERPAVGQLDHLEALASLDDHVEPSVGKLLDHFDDGGSRPDPA